MVVSILVDAAVDCIFEKAVGMSFDAALQLAVKTHDRHMLKDEMEREMNNAINENDIHHVITDILNDKPPFIDKKYNTTFKKGIINSALRPKEDDHKGLSRFFGKKKQDKGWFVIAPPVPKNDIKEVKADVSTIISKIRDAMWKNNLFRQVLGNEEFQKKVLEDIDDLKREVAEIRIRLERVEEVVSAVKEEVSDVKRTVSDLNDKLDSVSIRNTIIQNLQYPSESFVGRERNLEELKEAVIGKRIVFVNGFGGIGKTELCRKFCSDYVEDLGLKPVWLTYSGGSIRETIALGVRTTNELSRDMNIDEMFEMKKEMISSEGNILLVIDNYEWNNDIKDLDGIGCAVILTTRKTDIPAFYKTVRITEMSPDESFELLCKMATDVNADWIKANEMELREKLNDVWYHTLTVTLMGGLIATNRIDKDDTVSKVFDFTGCDKVYDRVRGEGTVMEHIGAIFKLSSFNQSSKDILRMASMLPITGMDYNDFLECSGADREETGNLIKSAWLNKIDADGQSLVLIHPVISELINSGEERPTLENEGCCYVFINKVSEKMQRYLSDMSIVELASLKDIVISFSDRIIKESNTLEDIGDMMDNLIGFSVCLSETGIYEKALAISLESIRIAEERIPDDGKRISEMYSATGAAYYNLGKYEKALNYHQRALAIGEKALPEDHPNIAASLNNIGIAYDNLGDYEKALEYYQRALAIREKALPEDNLDIAASLNNIGIAYDNLGEYAKALDYHQKALAIREKALPEDNLDIAASLNNIGIAYDDLGEYAKALDYHQKALAIREKALPEDNLDIAASLNNIGVAYDDLGEYAKALDYYQRALAIREKALPEDNLVIAASLNNIGNAYDDLGEYAKALDYHQRALAIREKALPEDHPDIATSLNNIGSAYNNIGEYAKALEYNQRALEIREKALPEDHPDTVASLINVGSTYYYLGEYAKALEYYKRALGIYEKILPEGDAMLIKLRNSVKKTEEKNR